MNELDPRDFGRKYVNKVGHKKYQVSYLDYVTETDSAPVYDMVGNIMDGTYTPDDIERMAAYIEDNDMSNEL